MVLRYASELWTKLMYKRSIMQLIHTVSLASVLLYAINRCGMVALKSFESQDGWAGNCLRSSVSHNQYWTTAFQSSISAVPDIQLPQKKQSLVLIV